MMRKVTVIVKVSVLTYQMMLLEAREFRLKNFLQLQAGVRRHASTVDVASQVELDTSLEADLWLGGNCKGAAWSNKAELNFIHIPRTGGTTLESCSDVFPKGASNSTLGLWGTRNNDLHGLRPTLGRKQCYGQHVPPSILTQNQAKTPYANRDSNFCVVRNPYDRLVSQYGFASTFYPKWSRAESVCSKESMNAYLLEKLRAFQKGGLFQDDCHFIPQTHFVFGRNMESGDVDFEQHWCNHVLRFEHLHEDFNALMSQFGYGVRLEKHGGHAMGSPSKCHALSFADLSDEVKSLAHDIYKQDFESFGYEPTVAGVAMPNFAATSVLSEVFAREKKAKIPVWVPFDFDEKSTKAFINLNLRALKFRADPKKFDVHLINPSNAREFAPDLPEEFDRLPDHGSRSDVLRAALIARHGGIYMDADVLFTQPLSFFADKLEGHDFVAYTANGQDCQKGGFSSNIIAARPGNRLSTEWWKSAKEQMKQACKFDEKDDKQNGPCCYSPGGAPRKRCHINWGGLGERTAHPIYQQILLANGKEQSQKPFQMFCFNEQDHAGFAPDPQGKLLWRALSTGKLECSENLIGGNLRNGRRAQFTQNKGEKQVCPCWEDLDSSLVCADGKGKPNFMSRGAYHMFNSIVGYISKDVSEQEILDGPWVASKLYRDALGMSGFPQGALNGTAHSIAMN